MRHQKSSSFLAELLPPALHSSIPFLQPYLLTSFGSFTRMDYGTGHETSFAIFLLCLTLLRFLEPKPDIERDLVLNVFTQYLRLCWRLQDVYKLEPAGSHGVWGLDDSHFLGYIFGSGQLLGSSIFFSLFTQVRTQSFQTRAKFLFQPCFILRYHQRTFISCLSCVFMR